MGLRRIAATLVLGPCLVGPVAAACHVALTPADIDRVLAISIGSEFGDRRDFITKWTDEVRIEILGTPTQADRRATEAVVAELGQLIAPAEISIVTENANVRLHFAPIEEFPRILPSYRPINYGYFSMVYNGVREIYDADVLISTTGLTRAETNHLIREKVTQVLGMGNDLMDASDSIFYGRWTDVEDYSLSDTKVVRAVYCPDVVTGMTTAEIRGVLEREAPVLGVEQIRALQRNLLARGHDIGAADGVAGRRTREAITSEQERLGLFADGEPSLGLLRALKVKS